MNRIHGDIGAETFMAHRRHLLGLAYRMVGSLADAEDLVQEAFLRWQRSGVDGIENPRAFLSKIVVRLCLDHAKSARVQREQYVGPWLPEPVLDSEALRVDSSAELAHDVSVALLLMMERLSPLERAAFLLHDVFDMDYADVAAVLERDEDACRQLAARGRFHAKDARHRFSPPPEEGERLTRAFLDATASGDPRLLVNLLAERVVLRSDGGGKKTAALKPVEGRERIAAFVASFSGNLETDRGARIRFEQINGLPGAVVVEPDGTVDTMAFEFENGLVTAIYIVRNPDKLRHIPA
jgi:RNA polymerase sigma-70 factor (ECF subfamily)